MLENEEWLFRPLLNGMYKYESLLDGTIGIADIALMNEALDVKSENDARYERYTASIGKR